jgi:16S rRNA (guanine527-N7)-methyltransferase
MSAAENAVARLVEDASSIGVAVSAGDAGRLLVLLQELSRWSRAYNLTAITEPAAMITHHLLDSLAIHRDLHGTRIVDVGTGAGFPGLPLALTNPQRQFTLVDASAKKIRFVAHAAQLLGLGNVTPLQARAENLRPETPFDTVVARAFAPLPRLLERVAALCAAGSRVLAMKGQWPTAELAELPPAWRLLSGRELLIPGLNEARCVIVLALR